MTAVVDRGATKTAEWRHVVTIGRVELRRRWRALRQNSAQLLVIAFSALFLLPFSAIALFGLYYLGTALRSGDVDAPLELARLGLVYGWIGVLVFGGLRAYSTALRPDRLDGLLTTVSHRVLLGGLLVAELALWGVPVVAFATLGALAFAIGSGSVLVVPLAIATVTLVATTALTGGFLLALAVRNTGVRSTLLTRLRTLLLAIAGVAYFGLIFTQSFDTVLAPLFWLLEPTPIGWYADLLLTGTVVDASVGRSVGAVLASGAFLLAGALALPRLAAWLWYADGVHVDRTVEAASPSPTDSRLDALLPRPVAGVVLVDWTRAKRAPVTLSFVLYPLFVLIGPTTTTVQTGTVGGEFPLLVALCGAWITGALFALNVLGSEGAVLPSTVLGVDPGRSLVGGHVVASALVGAPLTVAATLVLGIASPRSLSSVLVLTASALVLAVCAPLVATGVGVVFPRFDEVRIARSTKAIVPSTIAFGAYSLVLSLLFAPALLGNSVLVADALASWTGISTLSVALSGTVVSALVAVPVGVLSVRYAVRAVETFHFD